MLAILRQHTGPETFRGTVQWEVSWFRVISGIVPALFWEITKVMVTRDGRIAVIIQNESSDQLARWTRWPMPFFSSLPATSNTATSVKSIQQAGRDSLHACTESEDMQSVGLSTVFSAKISTHNSWPRVRSIVACQKSLDCVKSPVRGTFYARPLMQCYMSTVGIL